MVVWLCGGRGSINNSNNSVAQEESQRRSLFLAEIWREEQQLSEESWVLEESRRSLGGVSEESLGGVSERGEREDSSDRARSTYILER